MFFFPLEITCPVPGGSAQLITECSKPLTNLRPNSFCSFSCEPGFELQGAAHRKCSLNGQWSGVQPSCKGSTFTLLRPVLCCTFEKKVTCLVCHSPTAVQCPPPEPLENGYTNCSDSQPFFSSQCSFTCDEGFTLDGHELLTCGRHGNWTGKTPTCQGKTEHPKWGSDVSSVWWSCSHLHKLVLAAPSYQVSAITIGVTAGGAAAVSGLSLAMWILKRLKRKASKFELNR